MQNKDVEEALKSIGMSEGEIKVYLALLKLGSIQVSKIKEETGLHRTTIYDFIEKLQNKGLISYVIQNNIKFFKAAEPDKLFDIIKEKQEKVRSIMKHLKTLSQHQEEEIEVEIYKGKEGFKTVLNDMLRAKTEKVGFGIDESHFKKKYPILMKQYFKKEEKLGIKERILTSEKTKFIFKRKNITYRFVPEEYFSPTPTIIYGNKVYIHILDKKRIILIKSKVLTNSYKKHFEMLWKIAKKTRK